MLSPGFSTLAVLVIEREPYKAGDLWGRGGFLWRWVQDIGAFAALGLAFWLVAYLVYFRHVPPRIEKSAKWQKNLFILAVCASGLAYGLVGILSLPDFSRSASNLVHQVRGEEATRAVSAALARPQAPGWKEALPFVGGICALFAVLLPFEVNLLQLRPRRIWALARLTFKEAIRRRVLWVFLALLLVFLFAGWFLPYKPEHQVQTYVEFVYFTMSLLLLITAGLLAALGIPAEVRSQSIHTIVTKPVERFEIVLGRFLGTIVLMTIVLVTMSLVSLLYLGREIDPEAAFESQRARIALFGDLQFFGPRSAEGQEFQGEYVGRVWLYRRYIPGGPQSPYRAIWEFRQLPTRLEERQSVPCEFGFDIYRTAKGERENEPATCTLFFTTRNYTPESETAYRSELGSTNTNARPGEQGWEVLDQLAAKYGYFEAPSRAIADYHTQFVDVPVGLFINALKERGGGATAAVPLRVAVKCESRRQLIGVAPRDLYLVDAEGFFWANFLKGTVGLWLQLCLVVGVGVALSTYLSGIVSWLTTMILFLMGLAWQFIESLAAYDVYGKRTSIVGGPAESLLRLITLQKPEQQLAATPASRTAGLVDDVYAWILRNVLLKIVPDVDRFSWTEYVAKGFDVSAADLGMNALLLTLYLLPWAVLAYYLIRSREVASW